MGADGLLRQPVVGHVDQQLLALAAVADIHLLQPIDGDLFRLLIRYRQPGVEQLLGRHVVMAAAVVDRHDVAGLAPVDDRLQIQRGVRHADGAGRRRQIVAERKRQPAAGRHAQHGKRQRLKAETPRR